MRVILALVLPGLGVATQTGHARHLDILEDGSDCRGRHAQQLRGPLLRIRRHALTTPHRQLQAFLRGLFLERVEEVQQAHLQHVRHGGLAADGPLQLLQHRLVLLRVGQLAGERRDLRRDCAAPLRLCLPLCVGTARAPSAAAHGGRVCHRLSRAP